MSKKIGFWSVFAIVTGSQIGATIFISPATLAQYGAFSLLGWLISAIGAIALCFVFAFLCERFPQTGGPHVYINHAFGKKAAFFSGWTYWVISWVSSTVVTITAIGALSPFFGELNKFAALALQIFLLLAIALLNAGGVRISSKAESVLTLMKFVPLLLIPLAALPYFDKANFQIAEEISKLPTSNILNQVVLLTFFGFIGLECATAPAAEIHEPSKNIPRAIVSGTFIVALIYLLNSAAIIGMMPSHELSNSKAPYVDAVKIIFGGNWYFLISFIMAIVCIGSLNAWILTSGQIALGLSQDGLMPKIFAKKNHRGAPYFSIFISCAGIVPLLALTLDDSLTSQINRIIDFSVSAFLFVYLLCCLAVFRLWFLEKKSSSSEKKFSQEFSQKFSQWIFFCAIVAAIFCLWIIFNTSLISLSIAALFVCSGIPVYFFWIKKIEKL